MGVVYQATDPELDRKVAIKLLHTEDAGERILAEAKALARLRHPNVVSVYEVGKFAGHTFIAMEHVEGRSLADWLKDEERSWKAIVDVFAAAGRGLAAAHAAGLVHRDFKPENVVVGADGEPRVVDFGLARSAEDDAPTSLRDVVHAKSEATKSRLAGTPEFMAHELFDGQAATAKSDQYAFSVALYRALFGSSPFEIENTVQGTKNARPPKKPASSDVPGRVVRAVSKGLAPQPGDRHADMTAAITALTRTPSSSWLRASAIGGVALVAAIAWWQTSRPPLCAGGNARVAEIWGPDARERVQAAFESSKSSSAKTLLGTVQSSLDAYSASWVAMYTESCKATNERGDQSRELLDLRSQCLERRRAALGAVVSVLGSADDNVVVRSVALVEGLPSLSSCADVTNLQAGTKLPEDPTVRGRVQELQKKLEEARATFAAGRLKPAAESAKTLGEEAKKLDHRPFTGEVAFLMGSIASAQGKWDDAERELSEAVKLGQASGQSELVARAASKLVQVTGGQQAKFEKAHVWQAVAEASIERVADAKLGAELDLRVAQVLHEEGKIDESLVRVQRATERMVEMGRTETVEYSNYLVAWGVILDTKGRYEEALEKSNQALALREKLVGPNHPDVARTLNNIAVSYSALDRYDEAKVRYERAVKIAEEIGDMDTYTGFLDNLSGALFQLGRSKEGFAMRKKALAIRQKTLQPNHPDIADSWNNLGVQYVLEKRRAEGRDAYEKALTIYRKAYGNEHPLVAMALANLGEVYGLERDFKRARELLVEALGIEERVNRDSPRSASFLTMLGSVEVASKLYTDAKSHLDRAVRILEKSKSDERQLATARFLLAKILWERDHDKKGARALAEKAKVGPFSNVEMKPVLAEIDDWLRTHR